MPETLRLNEKYFYCFWNFYKKEDNRTTEKIMKYALVPGLILSFVVPSCSIFRERRYEEEPWVNMGVTKEQYEAMQDNSSHVQLNG